jgi:putative hemolysin/predicted secreted protein
MNWKKTFILISALVFILNFFSFVVAVPNPAAVYCVQNGYKSEIRQLWDSYSEFGVCNFNETSECDEWEYYRGQCKPEDCTGIRAYSDCTTQDNCTIRIICTKSQPINVNVGDLFNVTKSCNPSTGYNWWITYLDKNLLQSTKNGTTDCSSLIGGGCQCFFEFKTMKSGNTYISFLYYRLWEGTNRAIESDHISVSISNCPLYFTCPNGTRVPWCGFANNKCVCIISPENQCVGYCTEGKNYTCPNSKKVPWCSCVNHQLVCIVSPENQCSSVMTTTTTIVTTIPTTTTIPQEKTETNFTLIFYGIVIVGLLIAASIYFSRKK